jgi:hypothetical protein
LILLFYFSKLFFVAMAQQPPTPYVSLELLDETIDKQHRSYLSAICGRRLGTVRARTSRHLLPLHPRWIPKYAIRYSINLNINLSICVDNVTCTNTFNFLDKATRSRTSSASTVSRGRHGEVSVSCAGSHHAVRVRLLAPLCTDGQVAARDTHVPLSLWRDDDHS